MQGTPEDLVSIADVGFGISQTLPVIVALLAAEPGQLVYIEQPEIHLHPRAQMAMAKILADAANRGVRVVAETHSSLLLLGIQSLVAEGKLSPDKSSFTGSGGGPRTVSLKSPVPTWTMQVLLAIGPKTSLQRRWTPIFVTYMPLKQDWSRIDVIRSIKASGDRCISCHIYPGSEAAEVRMCQSFLRVMIDETAHRLVMTREIGAEWDIHSHPFARHWRRSMNAKRRVDRPSMDHDQILRQKIVRANPAEKSLAAMEKDLHLIEAARTTDSRIVSLDDTARRLFSSVSGSIGELREILWVNPANENRDTNPMVERRISK